MEPLNDPAQDAGVDQHLIAAVDDALIGDVLADLPEAQPDRALQSATDFSSLYVRHRSGLAAHARRYLRDARDVDEVVQETFLRLFLAISEIDTELQAIAFARRTLTNLCIDRYRADKRRPTLITLDASPYFDLNGAEEEPDPVLQAEDAAIVREALARLSPLHRAALVKREIEEKALPQIAAELGVAEESVKHLLFRARRALRRLLVGTSVEPGADLAGADGVPGEPNPLVRGATVIILFLVGALVVATGIRPLLSGGGRARPATGAVGAPQLGLANRQDPPAPQRSHPASVGSHHRAHPAVASISAASSPTIRIDQPDAETHRPARHTPVRHAPRGHFHLSGSGLNVRSTPRVIQGGVAADGSGTTVALSSFSADTDHGFFELTQQVKTSPTSGSSVAVTPSFVVGSDVEQPQLTGSAASVDTESDGTVVVDLIAGAQPDASTNAFPLTSLVAHFELTPDLSKVLTETVMLSTRAPAHPAPVSTPSPNPPGGSDGTSDPGTNGGDGSGTQPAPSGADPTNTASPPPGPPASCPGGDPAPPASAPPGGSPACTPAEPPASDTTASSDQQVPAS
ncbi:MAG TPA: RNA polymerase sigma factor [Mycobacteriales bacterium]|nr:RNA polymerase sigma factor [Mycobacteriales bacterium]